MIDNKNSENFIEALRSIQGNKIICGDFNLPDINWKEYFSPNKGERKFLEFFQDNFLEQKVSSSTHRKGNTLDLVLTNDDQTIAEVPNLGPLGSSDHDMLSIDVLGSEPDSPSSQSDE